MAQDRAARPPSETAACRPVKINYLGKIAACGKRVREGRVRRERREAPRALGCKASRGRILSPLFITSGEIPPAHYFTPRSSTSKSNVALGGMTRPEPRRP